MHASPALLAFELNSINGPVEVPASIYVWATLVVPRKEERRGKELSGYNKASGSLIKPS